MDISRANESAGGLIGSKWILPSLVIVLLIIRFTQLGAYPLMDTTEARYAEIGREMANSNDWITPTLNEKPFWAKPPLSFWLTAASFRIFGYSEFAARIPHFLVSLFTLALTFILASRMFGKQTACLSVLILLSSGLFHATMALVMTDETLMFTVTLALVAFFASVHSETSVGRLAWGYVFFAGLGLSLLAKGPVGAVLILLPIGAWAMFHQRWRETARTLPLRSGTLLMLLISVPWYVLGEIKTPGFLRYFLVGEHLQRFLISGWEGDRFGNSHEHIRGTIWLYGLIATLPWGILIVAVLQRMKWWNLRQAFSSPDVAFLICWFLSPLVLFTLAGNIIITYILPGLPAMAILFAAVLIRSAESVVECRDIWPMRRVTVGLSALLFPVLFAIASTFVLPEVGKRKSDKDFVEYVQGNENLRLADLIHFEKRPYSSEFYSRDSNRLLTKEQSDIIRQEFKYDPDDVFVVRKKDLYNFQQIVGKTMLVGMHDDYLLLASLHSCIPEIRKTD